MYVNVITGTVMERSGTETTRRKILGGLALTAGSVGVLGGVPSAVTAQENRIELDGYTPGWEGVAPDSIAGETNPTLELEAGVEYTLVWFNRDGDPHNVIIENSEEENLVRSEIISGGSQEITFTATPEMTSYYCEVHPTSMRGDVEVSGELEATPTETTTEETPTETTTEEPSGEVHDVSMITDGDEYIFDPIGLHIEPGDTVRFINESGSHSATAYEDRIPDGTPVFDSGVLTEEGAEFEQTFDTEGTVDYFCTPHKDLGMIARLVVGDPGGPADGSMPPDADVPESGTIVDMGSVGWDEFQSGEMDTTAENGGGATETESPGLGIGSAVAALGAGALYQRYRKSE